MKQGIQTCMPVARGGSLKKFPDDAINQTMA
jgi:hypothetical protein